MIKEKIQKLRESLKIKEGENNKKTIENLVLLVIIIIITVVAINYIWSGKDKKQNSDSNKKLAVEESISNTQNDSNGNVDSNSDIEERLANILSNIKGVGKVKVLITYSQTSQIIPLYDEDSSISTTEETDSGGGTRIVNENSTKKEIIYEDNNGVKTPITQSIINPKIEGAIITAQGATNVETKTNIIQAVEAVTGLATYRIQVFEME